MTKKSAFGLSRNGTEPDAGNSTQPLQAGGNATGGNATAGAAVSSEKKSTNAQGALSLSNITVTTPPYILTRCDQVIMFEAQRILNMEDYTKKGPAFFTLSVYFVNMFDSKDNSKLLESINLEHIKTSPAFLQGSGTCILFKDAHSQRSVTLCLKTQDEINDIMEAYEKFLQCRMGNDLSVDKFDPVVINSVMTASCMGKQITEKNIDLGELRGAIKQELETSGFTVKDTTGTASVTVTQTSKTPEGKGQTFQMPDIEKKIDMRVPGTFERPETFSR